MLKHISGVLVGLGLALLAAGCSGSKPSTVSAANPVSTNTPEGTVPAAAAQEEPVVASGPLVLENQIDVSAQREGMVTKILAEPGTRVRAGQILALLDDRQISADLDSARAKTRSIDADLKNWESEAKVLQSDYERAQKMWDAQLNTKEQLDHAKFKAESDQWDVKRVQELRISSRETEHSLELELEKTRIRAPFDGLVARRYVRAGEKVTLGSRLFWVTGEGPLRVRFTLPEKLMRRVKKGQSLPLTSPNAPDEKHVARVIEISPVVDPASGTIEVMAELEGPQADLRPGMTVNLRFDNPQ